MRPLLVALLTGCGAAMAHPPPRMPEPAAVGGYWALADDSHVVMQVTLLDGRPVLDAWATDSGIHFEIADLTWNGRALRASFTYPPTGTRTHSELVLVDSDRLEGEVTGPYRGRETWIRVGPDDVKLQPGAVP